MFRETKPKRRKLNNSKHKPCCSDYIYKTNKKMYNLNEAFKNMTSESNRVWACDKKKADGKLGKFFIVKSSKAFYEYLCTGNTSLNWYEVILNKKIVIFIWI